MNRVQPKSPPAGPASAPRRPLAWVLGAALLFTFVLAPPHEAKAQNVRDLEARIAEIADQQEQDMAAMQREIRALTSRVAELEGERDALRNQVTRLETESSSRGFEQVGSGWRFAVGSSSIEIDDSGVRIDSPGSINLQAGGSLVGEGGVQVEWKGPGTGLLRTGPTGTEIRGTMVGINASLSGGGGGVPAARVGDQVHVNTSPSPLGIPFPVPGSLVTAGSSTVLIGG